ncbi:hypothetical protein CR164_03670 [Prosthecochloris marina]|uniref:Uncharacterized protein n=2 Tax=Prosthecochloris marina TaxID=2017681 RepID=A0A317T8J3_9CHLB|nr:hypothetical protein CR164_03670 [Prosthecochloris marina]
MNMTESQATYAVLTGDLVKSSRLPSTLSTKAMAWLKASVSTFNTVSPGSVYGSMDTFRHDSWQLLLNRPENALRAALFFRTVLRMNSNPDIKYDTRIAIGIGEVEYIDPTNISNSRGPAFTRSGKLLDSMKNSRLAWSTEHDALPFWSTLKRTTIPLLDCLVSDWTPTESQAVNSVLTGLTQDQTAARWQSSDGKKPTRQAVGGSLQRAHWNTIHDVLLWTEQQIADTLNIPTE